MIQKTHLGFHVTLLSRPNFIKLKRELGHEGVGIYFALCLKLSVQPDYKITLKAIDDLAYDLRCDTQTLRSIVTDYNLFNVDPSFNPSFFKLCTEDPYGKIKN